MDSELLEILRTARVGERLLAVTSMLALIGLTWLGARWLGRRLRGVSRFGLRGLERLAAPLAFFVGLGFAALGYLHPGDEPPLFEVSFELLAIIAGFWFVSRLLDVIWLTGRRSARLRADSIAASVLLAAHHVGKLLLVLVGVIILAVRLGASEQLYLVFGGIGAALVFAAREPIQNTFSFVAILLDPPFHMGDRVRLVDFRGGEECVGEVVSIALISTTIRTGQRTLISLSNTKVMQLRVENLSAADRRRIELVVPVTPALSAEALRAVCDEIENDLAASTYVTRRRQPRVWLSGIGDGLRIKASAWLRRAVDRRDAQRELLLQMRARIEQHTRVAARSSRGVKGVD